MTPDRSALIPYDRIDLSLLSRFRIVWRDIRMPMTMIGGFPNSTAPSDDIWIETCSPVSTSWTKYMGRWCVCLPLSGHAYWSILKIAKKTAGWLRFKKCMKLYRLLNHCDNFQFHGNQSSENESRTDDDDLDWCFERFVVKYICFRSSWFER